MQVIADHARTATFLITDGVTPSNEWRGYVLRRIMRRSHAPWPHARAHRALLVGCDGRRWWRSWATPIPEIVEAQARVESAVKQEEERFAETLSLGMAKIDEYIRTHGRNGAGECSQGRRRSVPLHASTTPTGSRPISPRKCSRTRAGRFREEAMEKFEAEMEAQRARARAGASFGGAAAEATARSRSIASCPAQLPSRSFSGTRRWPRPRASSPWWRGTTAHARRA